MIKKRKRKKFRGKDKSAETNKTDVCEEQVVIVRKPKKTSFSNVLSSFIPKKRKVENGESVEPPKKIQKTSSSFSNKRDEIGDYYKVKDARERILRSKMKSEDFIPLKKNDYLYYSAPQNRKKEAVVVEDDDREDDRAWEIEQLQNALGRTMRSKAELFEKKNYQKKQEQEDQSALLSFSFSETCKTATQEMENDKIQISVYNEEADKLDNRITKNEKDCEKFSQDLQYLDEKYKYFQSLRVFTRSVKTYMKQRLSEFNGLKQKIFFLERKYYGCAIRNFFLSQNLSGEDLHNMESDRSKIVEKMGKVKSLFVSDEVTLQNVKSKFEHLKFLYSEIYFDSHMGLCVRKLFVQLINVEVLEWNIFLNPEISALPFIKLLEDYGKVNTKPNDPDNDIIPYLVKHAILPHVEEKVRNMFNTYSTKNNLELQRMVKELNKYLSNDTDYQHRIRRVVLDKFFAMSSIEMDLFIGWRDAIQNDFEMCLSLITNLLSWTNFDEKNHSNIPIEHMYSVVVENLGKKRIIKFIKEIASAKEKRFEKQNLEKSLFRKLKNSHKFPPKWIQAFHSIAQSVGVCT